MIELFFVRVQPGINISQTISTRHLGVCQIKELVECSILYLVFPAISGNADVKLMSSKKLKQLPKYGFA